MSQEPAADEFEHQLVAGGDHLREGRSDDAVVALGAALALRPDDPKALGLLGLAHFRRAAFGDARGVYERLVAQRPDDASYRLNLGLVYLKLGEAKRAVTELSRARELDPAQPRTVSYLGLAYARDGQYALAYEAFLRAGQSSLASEMEQHLGPEERARVAALLAAEQEPRALVAEVAVPAPVVAETSGSASAGRTAELEWDSGERPTVLARPPASASDGVGLASDAYDVVVRRVMAAAEGPALDDGRVSAFADRGGMITQAVADATPSQVARSAGSRVAAGNSPPIPVALFAAARLIRPEDGDHVLELTASGMLILRVRGRLIVRRDRIVALSGALEIAPATRRVRGAPSDEPLGTGAGLMAVVSGQGELIADPGDGEFAPVALDDDILYAREGLVCAFDEHLRWESGHLPGSDGAVHVLQLRGQGTAALLCPSRLVAVRVAPDRPLAVALDAVAGWLGRVVPRLAGDRGLVECTGEGVLLLSVQGER